MKNTTARISAILASTAVLTTGLAGVASTAAASVMEPQSASTPALKPIAITASQGSLNVTQMQLENISAIVTDAVTGQPLPGRMVKFMTVGGRLLGTAYTNYTGTAAISAPENFGPGTVQEILGGYDAVVLGDGEYAPASAHGAITIGTDCFGWA